MVVSVARVTVLYLRLLDVMKSATKMKTLLLEVSDVWENSDRAALNQTVVHLSNF